MNSFRRIITVAQKEILHILRDNIALAIAFIAPILLTVFVGYLYIPQKVTHVPIIIFDQDQTDVSRSIIRSFEDSERFTVTMVADDYPSMERAIQSEKVYMALVIPPRLKRDIKDGRSTQVGVILNGTNLVIMNTLANAANQVVATISGGITLKVMEGYGVTQSKAYQAVTALNFRTRYWYNPGTSYLVFMLLGLAGVIIQQITFMGVALSFSREKEAGTWGSLKLSKLKDYEIFIGKIVVYLVIYSLDALVVYGLSFYYFGIPMRGSAGLLIATIAIFMLALTTMGMMISIFTQNTSQAIELSMLVAVPSFLVSGYTWPQFAMIPAIRVISKVLPLTYFLEATRSIVYLGAGLNVVLPKLITLFTFSVVFLPLTALALNRRMFQPVP
jgi:ABC-2 type transport system permease protein